jgi:hypothetical protein
MAQMESKWIDTRSFEQITVETVPTEKYQPVVDMILRENRIFAGSQTIYDLEIVHKEREVSSLLEERKHIQSTIQTLKNSPKKVHQKKNASDNEEEGKNSGHSIMEKLYTLIGEQQDIDKKVENLKKEIQLLEAIQSLTVKRFASLNRLAKHYKDHQDLEFLRKGVHWVCEYGDKMIEREKKYHSH